MKRDDRRTCLVCGVKFPAAKEFCPVCMLRDALQEQAKPAEFFLEEYQSGKTFTRLSHRFEHYELATDEDGKPVELGRGAMALLIGRSMLICDAP